MESCVYATLRARVYACVSIFSILEFSVINISCAYIWTILSKSGMLVFSHIPDLLKHGNIVGQSNKVFLAHNFPQFRW